MRNFDLQFFGSSKTSSQQVQKRDPMPEELNTLAKTLYDKIYPGLQSFDPSSFSNLQGISDKAIQQQSDYLDKIPGYLDKSNSIIDSILNVTNTGNIPSGLTNAMNASVNKELQGSMGNMLNGLSSRGVLNSSITNQGVSRLGQQAADAYNKNYLNAYNSVLGGYGTALQGAQGNTNSLLSAINTVGTIPSQAYQNAYAGIMPAFNFWQTWQQLENSKPEMYDTVVTQKQRSCVTGDTIVTLADGEKVPVRDLKDDDEILVWDFDKGEVTSASLMAFFRGCDLDGRDVFKIMFEDGSNIGIVHEHLFFDFNVGKFVAVNAENLNYVGHEFAKVNEDGEIVKVKVAGIVKDGKVTDSYAPQPERHWNFLANGFISGNDGQLGFVNRFEFDTDAMKYDEKEKKADLLTFGTCGYDLFEDVMTLNFFAKNRFCES
ncbi:MAG: hypothetical protein IJ597_02860, partial [Synergistaceae bacterium]|nr:hypothetical protein [Synergistaceae bacterium]